MAPARNDTKKMKVYKSVLRAEDELSSKKEVILKSFVSVFLKFLSQNHRDPRGFSAEVKLSVVCLGLGSFLAIKNRTQFIN